MSQQNATLAAIAAIQSARNAMAAKPDTTTAKDRPVSDQSKLAAILFPIFGKVRGSSITDGNLRHFVRSVVPAVVAKGGKVSPALRDACRAAIADRGKIGSDTGSVMKWNANPALAETVDGYAYLGVFAK